MKCLILHCEKFSYKLDHPTPVADKNIDKKEDEFENSLVIFLAIEKKDNEEKIEKASKEIIDIYHKLNPDSVVVNPFAHLSSSLAGPKEAKELSIALVDKLKEELGDKVIYTFFGWYKSFITDVYGHDNSQLFREV